MFTFNVCFVDHLENKRLIFKVRATNKNDAINQAIARVKKKLPFCNYNYLNNYNISLIR